MDLNSAVLRSDVGIFLVCLVIAAVLLFVRVTVTRERAEDEDYDADAAEAQELEAVAFRASLDEGVTWTIYSYDPSGELDETAIVRPLFDLIEDGWLIEDDAE